MSEAKSKVGVKTYLTLSFVSALIIGIVVYGGVKRQDPALFWDGVNEALLWAGITFIVVLVGIATLALTVKDDDHDPDQPRLK